MTASTLPDPFTGVWPAAPTSVPEARHAAVAYLRGADTPDPPLGDIELVVSEAITNVVHHAYHDRDVGEVRLTVELTDDEVGLIVEDDGRGMMPRPDSPGLGLGLPLIATVSDRFDTRSEPGKGTRLCIWFKRFQHEPVMRSPSA